VQRARPTSCEPVMDKPAHFKVAPKLAALLCEGYRSSEEALRELVDNAWDADADTVTITLPGALSGDPIVVEDDGTGMSKKEVLDEYLDVANDRRSRKGQYTSGKKRLVKGRKGIGKFAGLMAADTMIIETRAWGQGSRLTVRKADLDSRVGGRDLEKIDLPIEPLPCKPSEHGTRIILTGLAQNLAFPNDDKLREILVQEYDREENFSVVVNGIPLTIDDIAGEPSEYSADLPRVGPVRLKYTISETKPLKRHGIAIWVGGKIIGRPSMLGLEDDETIPRKLLKRVYGELVADGLAGDLTGDFGAIIENSLGLGEVKKWASEKLRESIKAAFSKDISLQKARIAKEVRQALDKLPENRRMAAERLINRILERFYSESDDRVKAIVRLTLEALEDNDYWVVLKSIDDSTRADVVKLAMVLDEFGIADIAVVAQQASRRLTFLDEFDQLISKPETLEQQVHKAIENNLWIFGSSYRLISSNKSLAKTIAGWTGTVYTGEDARTRPDLFLATLASDEYLLIEFKRPSHAITRDDEFQVIKYRDALQPTFPGVKIEVLVVGGSVDPKMANGYKTDGLKVASYAAIVALARTELTWLVRQLREDT
jgi:Histidine kinase-, DNA gyrase B-, and HSP90-like ATPase